MAILLLASTAVAGCSDDTDNRAADCGRVTVSAAAERSFAGCFDEHFAGCTPAAITLRSEGPPLKGTVVRYEIEGPGSGGCNVRWRYETLPVSPSWENADVVCPYPTGPDFQAAMATKSDFKGCTGPLLKLAGGAPSSGGSSSGTITVP